MAILLVEGTAQSGKRDFTQRMTDFRAVFEEAVGETLQIGTLNIRLDTQIPIKPHFKIEGKRINEPDQDLLFEVCRVNGFWAYRIRPYQPATGRGGHGDHIIEVTCHHWIPGAEPGNKMKIEFFR